MAIDQIPDQNWGKKDTQWGTVELMVANDSQIVSINFNNSNQDGREFEEWNQVFFKATVNVIAGPATVEETLATVRSVIDDILQKGKQGKMRGIVIQAAIRATLESLGFAVVSEDLDYFASRDQREA